MKRVFLAILLLIGTLLFAEASANSITTTQTPGGGLIVGIKPDKVPPTRPKQIVGDDITAQYYNGVLTIDFNIDLGTADIVVTNLTTGEAWSDTTSGLSSVAMLLSGDGGYYTVEIATDYGTYSGVFEL